MWKKFQAVAFAVALVGLAIPAAYAGPGCCPGTAAKEVKEVATKSACSADKSSAVVNVSTKEAAACATACGDKATKSVVNVAAKGDCAAACAAACGDKAAKSVVNVAAKGECAKACADKGACGGCDTMKAISTVASGSPAGNVEAAGLAGNDALKARTSAYTIGARVDPFALTHAKSGATKSIAELAGEKATVLIFWNQNCPYVVEVVDRVDAFASEMGEKGVSVVAIDAGVDKPVEAIKEYEANRKFPILVNRDGEVAAAFGATRTPEVFILNSDMQIVYHGAFDSGRGDEADRKHFVRDAVSDLMAGNEPSVKQTRAFGCTIKYANGVKALAAAN